MIYSIDEISDLIFLSRNTIRERIKLLGLISQRKDSSKTYYYNEEQIELIKENRYIDYQKFTHTIETFYIYESKLNFN
jgi:DNA-binding transcriptional MerR regulator